MITCYFKFVYSFIVSLMFYLFFFFTFCFKLVFVFVYFKKVGTACDIYVRLFFYWLELCKRSDWICGSLFRSLCIWNHVLSWIYIMLVTCIHVFIREIISFCFLFVWALWLKRLDCKQLASSASFKAHENSDILDC